MRERERESAPRGRRDGRQKQPTNPAPAREAHQELLAQGTRPKKSIHLRPEDKGTEKLWSVVALHIEVRIVFRNWLRIP